MHPSWAFYRGTHPAGQRWHPGLLRLGANDQSRHVIDAVTAPITSNRPTTHDYTTMRDATENVWVDKNLITANSAAGLDRARAILEYLDVYPVETINTWYQYYSTGNPEFFFKLMAN